MTDDVYTIYLISFLVFIAVITLIEGAYLLWRALHEEGMVKMSRRLKSLSAGGESHRNVVDILKRREMSGIPFINRILIAIPRLHSLDRMIEQSGVEMSVSRFLAIQLVFVGLFMLLFALLLNLAIFVALPFSLFLGMGVPLLTLMKLRSNRSKLFSTQLPDTLDYIARSLRAGNPFSASLKSVSNEMPDPIGTEFGITFEEMNYGLEFEEAMVNLGKRTGSEEMNYFITAVLIQRTTGGNLADMLNNLAEVMRARASTYREIDILAAEMKISANVLIGLPFLVAGVLYVGSPGYLDVLFETVFGNFLILLQLILIAIGYFTIRKMIHFRV